MVYGPREPVHQSTTNNTKHSIFLKKISEFSCEI